MAKQHKACGFESKPDGTIRLWIGGTDGANGPALSDNQIDALVRNIQAAKVHRGQMDLTWVVPTQ